MGIHFESGNVRQIHKRATVPTQLSARGSCAAAAIVLGMRWSCGWLPLGLCCDGLQPHQGWGVGVVVKVVAKVEVDQAQVHIYIGLVSTRVVVAMMVMMQRW